MTIRLLSSRASRAAARAAAAAVAVCAVAGGGVAQAAPSTAAGSVPSTAAGSVPSSSDSIAPLGSLAGLPIPGSLGLGPVIPDAQQGFDLEAHRGGRGEFTEESATAFTHALDLNVSTLELDVVVAEDGTPVVWHDPSVQAEKCSDTAPATPNDPEFPYVGKLVHELNWQQLQTLDCGKKLADFPNAQPVPGNKMLQLKDVFALAANHPNGHDVHFNIETKLEAEKRADSATPQQFLDAILPVIHASGADNRSVIQSFDWRSLELMRDQAPQIPTVLLWDDTTWTPGSVWTGSVNFNAAQGDITRAAKQVGASILSPDFALVSTESVSHAHAAGLTVVPWTVNESADITSMIDAGVDGIITDYPTRALEILNGRGVAIA